MIFLEKHIYDANATYKTGGNVRDKAITHEQSRLEPYRPLLVRFARIFAEVLRSANALLTIMTQVIIFLGRYFNVDVHCLVIRTTCLDLVNINCRYV
jgi:hypothetical protein